MRMSDSTARENQDRQFVGPGHDESQPGSVARWKRVTGRILHVLIQDRVLVIDRETETADVLRAVLEPRGVTVSQVRSRPQDAIEQRNAKPAVLVIDLEQSPLAGPHAGGPDRLPDTMPDAWQDVPRVIIGRISMETPSVTDTAAANGSAPSGSSKSGSAPSLRRRLSKPFHYGELIGAIEQLLAESPSV